MIMKNKFSFTPKYFTTIPEPNSFKGENTDDRGEFKPYYVLKPYPNTRWKSKRKFKEWEEL